MKRSIFTVIILCIAMISNAQVFVGGGFGFSAKGSKTEQGSDEIKGNTIYSFSIQPLVGYVINPQIAVGMKLAFGMGINNNNAYTEVVETKHFWGINPFMRYYFLKLNKFKVYEQTNIVFSGASLSTKTGVVKNDDVKTRSIGVSVVPALSYSLTDKIRLVTELNFLGLNFEHLKETTPNVINDVVETSNSFGFGFDSRNLLNMSNLQIGFAINL